LKDLYAGTGYLTSCGEKISEFYDVGPEIDKFLTGRVG
jgi:hypothetical protein